MAKVLKAVRVNVLNLIPALSVLCMQVNATGLGQSMGAWLILADKYISCKIAYFIVRHACNKSMSVCVSVNQCTQLRENGTT